MYSSDLQNLLQSMCPFINDIFRKTGSYTDRYTAGHHGTFSTGMGVTFFYCFLAFLHLASPKFNQPLLKSNSYFKNENFYLQIIVLLHVTLLVPFHGINFYR